MLRYNPSFICTVFLSKHSSFTPLIVSFTVFFIILSLNAQATTPLEPLADNEGYVVIPLIIEGYPPYDVKLEDTKVFGESHKVRDLVSGLNFSLIKLPAGDYRWARINFRSDHYFNLEDHDFKLNVKPGVINYGGHLAIDINYRFATARYNYINRSSSVIDELTKHHPEIYEQYPLIFAGHSPDPFNAFYKALVKQQEEQ